MFKTKTGGLTSVKMQTEEILDEFKLHQNYPNPFNPSTRIVYRVESPASAGRRESVTLKVYDVLGREIATLVNERKDPGEYTVDWNSEGKPSGVYYYRLITSTRVETRKAVLVR
jgi:hypothetical protein